MPPKKLSLLMLTVLVCTALLLAGCGPFFIQVEPLPTAVPPTGLPTPPVIVQIPTGLPTPAVIVQTPTIAASPTGAPTQTAEPNLNRLKPGTPLKITRLKMIDAQKGWALGQGPDNTNQHVLFTNDSGATWADRTPAQANITTPVQGLGADAYFSSVDQAWVIYGGPDGQENKEPVYVFHTGDGGKTWTRSQPLALADLNMEFSSPSDLGFRDDRQGWVMLHLGVGMSHDYFAAFTTADGGSTWKRVLDPNTPYPLMSCYKTGLVFTGPSEAWLSASCPGLMPLLFFYHSVNGGVDWTIVSLPDPAGKPAGYLIQNGSVGCGITALQESSARPLALTVLCTNFNNNSAQSWLYSAGSGGGKWTQQPLPVPYLKLNQLPSGEAFLVGSLQAGSGASGAVFHSSDGSNWSQVASTAWTGVPDFVDSHSGWVIAGHDQVTALVHTSDGGKTWVEIKPLVAPYQ